MILPFGSGSYQHRSRPLSAQRMVNCYLEAAPPGAKTLAANVPAFGIEDFADVGNGDIRGGLTVNGRVYVVSGTSLYELFQGGTSTELGTIPNSDRVFMAADGTNVFVTTGGDGYIYNGTTVAQVTDTDFPGASCVAFLDGYMVIIEPESGRFYVCETPYAPDAWNALDFATAEAAPDDLVSLIIDHREVFLFGRESTEVWFNSGNADFPLERTPSGFIEIGCLSAHGPAKIDNTVFFPANDFTVRRLDGYTPVRISNHAIEQAIESYEDKTCYGMTWVEGGHSFYSLTFAEATWVFDCSTQLWHERQSYGQANWRPVFAVRAFNKLLVGDSTSERVGSLSADVFTEWGDPLVASATAPSVNEENRMIEHKRLELVFENGVGLASGQGSDPQVMLDYSDNGGRTWSNEYWRSLGAQGDYTSRAYWTRPSLGKIARDRVYRYTISDPVRRTLIQAVIDAA
jgi:hypothetical protein